MQFVIVLLILAVFAFLGLLYWAASALPLVIREIAVNTRKEGQEGDSYKLVDTLSVLLKVVAVLMWVIGLILVIAAIAAPGTIGRAFF